MQLNPILALELRSRWRSNRSFVLLFGVALALCLVSGFIYQRSVVGSAAPTFDPMTGNVSVNSAIVNDNARLGAVGRELFIALAHVNILVWLLVAAAAAATPIARERERGLLESLQLSYLNASSQIAARFAGNLMLLGALQLVLLPIYAVAFLMRGVSPLEVGQALVLVAWSAITGTALGLWFSARSHRPTGALFGALGAIALFSLWVFYNTSGGLAFDLQWRSHWLHLSDLFHPTALFIALTNPNFRGPTPPGDMLIVFSIAHGLLSVALLWSAARCVRRPLAPPVWGRNSAMVEHLRARQSARPPRSRAGQRASGALLADVPLDRFVRFSDPLLAREVKARFRLRRAGFWVGLARFALFLIAASVWLFELFWLFDRHSRDQMAPYGLQAMLYGGTLALAALAATSWTRERESGTWESLKLSLLLPRQILRAKWLSPLVSFAYYSAPLWILLPIGALWVPLQSFALGALVVTAWLGLAVALGLWVSWRVQNGAAAVAWTVGIMAMLIVGAPALNRLAGVDEALAQARFGVGSYRDMNRFYYGDQAPVDEDLARRYTADTGLAAPVFETNRTGRTANFYSVSFDFQQWGRKQVERAEDYKARLMLWNPAITLRSLFPSRDPSYNYSSWRRPEAAPVEAGTIVLWSALPPFALTLVLLLLLRRDVRREQLNA